MTQNQEKKEFWKDENFLKKRVSESLCKSETKSHKYANLKITYTKKFTQSGMLIYAPEELLEGKLGLIVICLIIFGIGTVISNI